ncbi:copper resistance protein NlpE [Rhodocytophaga aerolata]|uniref:Copper resistance protein NlpE n=1 Tax=Rhodocytophaga aerolata TaxID=455078 RepID=A0ABT8RBC3_9BACT|nr:copper resistance protein NlpE [Rhodocytophaga aerolata]MDO1449399.1 copper resistance protein NlpE [Rhodocytophaga aerolata]
MKINLILSLLAALVWSCGSSSTRQSDTATASTDTISVGANNSHNARNSLDYEGTYTGILPCADCQGIETEIRLYAGNSFVKKTRYLGKNDPQVFETTGAFTWNKAGNTIILEGAEGANQYLVGENTLTQLDQQGNKVTSQLADRYVLKK